MRMFTLFGFHQILNRQEKRIETYVSDFSHRSKSRSGKQLDQFALYLPILHRNNIYLQTEHIIFLINYKIMKSVFLNNYFLVSSRLHH